MLVAYLYKSVSYPCDMKNKRITTSTKRFLLLAVTYVAFLLEPVSANDPFEGNFFAPNCMKRRTITGCPNETLLSAYNKTDLAKTDKDTINEAKTRVYLFTPCNREKAEFLDECGGMLPENTNYRPDAQTVVVVGGYISPMCGFAIFREIKDQLLCRQEFINVLLVDWYWGNGPDYYGAARNTELVGKHLAFVIANIMNQTGASSEKFHIVGHSLGAHIAGCIGEFLQVLGKGKPRRITALDPAAPGFKKNSSRCSISKDDAKMVDVIHSNAGECLPFALGISWNIGHADFYPNGGSFQKSCYADIVTSFLKQDPFYALILLAGPFCPHFTSVRLFKESINACNCQFVGYECPKWKYKKGRCVTSCGSNGSTCAVMGYDWERCQPKFGNRSYFLTTNLRCPSCYNKGIVLGNFSTTPPKCGDAVNCYEPGRCPVHDC